MEEVSKRFGARLVVDRVSLEVHGGEVVGLLGPNGAGKTTTLRMLAGLLTPTAGVISLGGIDVAKEPEKARFGLGFLTTGTGLYDRLTPREILRTFGSLHGMDRAALEDRIAALTREMRLEELLDRKCGALSTGQKQRVSIARAVVHDPAAYVLDEPTLGLDPLASQAILELVRGARERGKAVIFSTHRMEEVEYLCDRLYFLAAGKVTAEGSPQKVREASGQSSLTAAFLYYAVPIAELQPRNGARR